MARELLKRQIVLTTSSAAFHTVPPDEVHQVTTMYIANADSADRWAKFWLVPFGQSATYEKALTSGQMPVPFNSQPMERYAGIPLVEGDALHGQAEVNTQICVTLIYVRFFPDPVQPNE
jgi:hypothetical protein